MTISTNITENGEIKCKTVIDGRLYRSRYRGCTVAVAKKRFRQRVELAERKVMENLKQEIIDACLNCQFPAKQCKGKCKFNQSTIKRGKGIQ